MDDVTPPRAFTPRAILVGTLCAIGVNLVTPYNDYVVANSFFVGSYLPLAMIVAVVGLVIVGNGLYRALAPARAFTTAELALTMLMLLVACAFPSQGLMRGLLPTMTTPFYFSQTNAAFRAEVERADLPAWLFPAPLPPTGRAPDVIEWFYGRAPEGERTPYGAWIKPLAGWGVYFAGLTTTLLALAYLLRIQWAQRERLPFPLATVQLALIEQPEPGRALNRLFRARSFWLVAAAAFAAHATSALHLYNDRVPELPLGYDFRRVLANPPWSAMSLSVRQSPVYFTFVGMAFFIRSRAALSMWATFLLYQLYAWPQSLAGTPVSVGQTRDQHLGACLAFALGVLWIGRGFFGSVARAAFGVSPRAGERPAERGAALAARWAIAGVAVMAGWFLVAGASPWLAALTIFVVLMSHVVTARIVAETGMPFVRVDPTVLQVLNAFDGQSLGPRMTAASIRARDLFFGCAFTTNGAFHTRESAMVFGQHGMRLLDEADAMPRRRLWPLAAVLAWTATISFVAASWSSLTCYYGYATPISPRMTFSVLNQDVLSSRIGGDIVSPMAQHASGSFSPRPYSFAGNVTAGFAVVVALQLATWGVSGWPLLPVGFLMVGTTYMGATWFSIFLGWLAKVALAKLGGPRLIEAARPAFIGMIFGECLAAAASTVVSLVLAVNGFDYFPYAALPK